MKLTKIEVYEIQAFAFQGQPGYDIPCSCGYDELMKELEESK